MPDKCTCGYEMRFPGEQEMFAQWGCARTTILTNKLTGGRQVTMCSGNTPPSVAEEDDSSLVEAYFQNKKKPNPNPDGNKG